MRKLFFGLVLVLFLQPGISQQLVNPNATPAAKAIKKFMDDQYGKKIISGQCNASWVDYIKQNTGQKEPAMMAYDFNHSTPNDFNPNWNDDQQAIAFFKRGGIPAFQWHWRDPMGAKSWDKYDFDLPKALADHNSNEYKNMIRDIDIVAGKIKNIQDAGAAIVFRPLHEAEGAWFWWGGYGKVPCQDLYKLIFYRLTNDWKLNNIIWVWNSYGTDKGESWYPGDQYADIIAYDYASSNTWNMYQNLFGGKGKLFGLAEEGKLPDPNNFSNNPWSFFVTWDYMIQEPSVKDGKNDKAWLYKVYNDPKTITLSDMPGWTGLNAITGPAQNLIDNDGDGVETVVLDGSASTSNSGPITSYTWKEGTTTLGTTAKISVSLPLGDHVISLTVTDGKNPASTTNVSVSVNKINLALNKPVTVSSLEPGANVAANATDGNSSTRWSSAYTDVEWIIVDLQKVYDLTQIVLKWEASYATVYKLEVSIDKALWQTYYSTTNCTGGIEKLSSNAKARYIRLTSSKRVVIGGKSFGVSLYEVEAYGSIATSLQDTPEASRLVVTPNPSNGIFNIVDCKNDKWSVYQLNGTLVLSGYGAKIDLSEFSAGIYLLKVDAKCIKLVKK